MAYDVLLVGAGLTNATICALLKDRVKICVIETRPYIGGNCYDSRSANSFIHAHGPHIFHSKCDRVVQFLSHYTWWNPYHYSVEAQIETGEVVPFPYSKQTEDVLGRKLSEEEVINLFFRGYSEKMWRMPWEDLPNSIKGRVPKDTKESTSYFPGEFQAMPARGYTNMIENMFDGVEVILNAGPDEWQDIRARKIFYSGRADLIKMPCDTESIGSRFSSFPEYRTLDIQTKVENIDAKFPVRNYCSKDVPYIRRVIHRLLTGGDSRIVTYETPRTAVETDLCPYYPVPTDSNIQRAWMNKQWVAKFHPLVTLCGRLGTYKYLDMYQAVGQGMALVKEWFGE